MATKEAINRAVSKYDKKRGAKGLYLKLYEDTDKDIINKLDTVDSKQGYVKGLIRKDITEGSAYGKTQNNDITEDG